MDMFALIAAFGGGIVGAYMGALPAFIMTGFFALAGGLAVAAGVSGDIAVGLAFGSFLGPHVAFAGGVAAVAYAGKKGKVDGGNDILKALYGLNEPDVMIVGGIFGAMGYVIATLISKTPLGPMTDLPGITVIILAIITRLVFGNTGLTGKCAVTDTRYWYSGGKKLTNNLVLGLGIGLCLSFVAVGLSGLPNWASISGIFPVICFGFSAITLIFTQTGFAVPGTHHITLPSAAAAVVGINAFGPMGALLGVAFAIAGVLVGDLIACTFNSHCDTHIDPPAGAIFSLTIVLSLISRAVA